MGNSKTMSGDMNFTDGMTEVPAELTAKLVAVIKEATK
jgi:hypothetical protein